MVALLDAGAARVQTELIAEPGLQADMLTLIGRTYRRLGAYDKAHRAAGAGAGAVGTEVYGADDLRVAEALDQLGGARAEKGDYAARGARASSVRSACGARGSATAMRMSPSRSRSSGGSTRIKG